MNGATRALITRIAVGILCSIVVVSLGIWIQRLSLFQMTPISMWKQPDLVSGVYSRESAVLPGARSDVPMRFKWSTAEMTVSLWPPTSQSHIIHLLYYNAFGNVEVSDQHTTIATIPPANTLRTAHILIPADATERVLFRATNAQLVADRMIGFIVIDASVGHARLAFSDNTWTGYLRDFLALPLTLLLLFVLGALSGGSMRAGGMAVVLGFIGAGILFVAAPWYIIAAQITLQQLIIVGLTSYFGYRLFTAYQVPLPRYEFIIIAVWLIGVILFFKPIIMADGAGYYAYVRSLFIDGDLDFTNDFDSSLSPFLWPPNYTVSPVTGLMVNPFPIGPALFWVPIWLVAHVYSVIGSWAGLPWTPNGYSEAYVTLTTFSSSLLAMFGMLSLYRLLQRWFDDTTALFTVISMYLGTNILYYTAYQGIYPHIFTVWLGSIMLNATLRLEEHQRRRDWLVLGASAAGLLLVYWVNVFVLIVPAAIVLCLVIRHWRSPWQVQRPLWIGIASAAILAAVLFAPQLAVWQRLQGAWYEMPRGSNRFTPQDLRLWPFLVGPLYGMVWWTPVYAIGLIGSVVFAIKQRWHGILFLVVSLGFILYNTSVPNWHGSGGFGLRRLTTIAPFLALGIAQFLQMMRHWNAVRIAVMSMSVFWSIRFMIRYIVYYDTRSPSEFLQTLRASLLSQEFVRTSELTAFQKFWFVQSLRTPSIEHIILWLTMVAMVVGAVQVAQYVYMRSPHSSDMVE